MATPADLAVAAATAFVASMGTDAWAGVRARMARLLHRHAEPVVEQVVLNRLDGVARDLEALPAGERAAAARVYSAGVARDLAPVAVSAAVELAELVKEFTPAAPAGGVDNRGLSIHDNDVSGDFNFGGHTNTVTGPGA